MLREFSTYAALMVLTTAAWSAAAIPLAPGGAVAPVGTTSAADPNLVGLVVASDPLRPFQILDGQGNVVVEGNLQDRVVVSAALGTMIFAPRLRDLIGTGVVVGLVDRDFAGFSTDVEYRVDGLGDVGPDGISRSAGAGDELAFSYAPSVIDPPEEALFLSVLTDALDFAAVGSTTIFARDVTGALYSVTLEDTNAPIPEPSTLVLGGLGLIALARGRRRAQR
jgi:hypothetical protein